jgi:hypothetical protein
MERGWEIFGEHMNDVDVSYSEQRHRTREAREDKICSKIEIAATTKLGLCRRELVVLGYIEALFLGSVRCQDMRTDFCIAKSVLLTIAPMSVEEVRGACKKRLSDWHGV